MQKFVLLVQSMLLLFSRVFQGGRLVHELELREAEQVEAALAYRKTVLTDWHEVNNALRLFVPNPEGLMKTV
jgi:outer membrane protein TolC